ncbi:MAG TPA: hypothetical protein VIH30_06240 [Aquirhabdus sp.]
MNYEVFAKGSQIIEADSADEARGIYAILVASEPTEDFIFAEEIEDEE